MKVRLPPVMVRPTVSSMDGSSDEDLLQRYAQGDGAAAQLLTSRYAGRVMGVAWRMLNDRAEAEDVTQEVMLRLWRIAPRWESGQAQLSTWLYRVASNLCTDRLRKRGRAQVGLDGVPETPDPAPSAAAQMQQAARDGALQEALSQLPDRQRNAVILRHIEGLTNPEIATIMDISVEAVESLTARGKRSLARILAGRRAELGFDDV